MSSPHRSLNQEELFVLNEIQCLWGPQNTEAEVFFTETNEAALLVKALDGSLPICVSLTNLGRWHAEGTLTLQDLRKQILGPAAPPRAARQCWLRFRAALVRFLRHSPPAR